jgi:hypothetical protein
MSDTKLTDKISEVIIMAIKKTPFFEKVENMLNVVGISILFTGVVTIINYYTLNNINSKICEQNIILKQNVTFLFEKQELLHKKIDKLLEDSKNMNSLLETKNMKVIVDIHPKLNNNDEDLVDECYDLIPCNSKAINKPKSLFSWN